jgi:hypothetical protein
VRTGKDLLSVKEKEIKSKFLGQDLAGWFDKAPGEVRL